MIPNIDYYLYIYPNIDKEIREINCKTADVVAEKREMKTTATITGMPLCASNNSDKIVNILIMCEEIQKDAILSINILETMRSCIAKELQVLTLICQSVIVDRYFNRKSWREIQTSHGITRNFAYVINSRFKKSVLGEFNRCFVLKS